MAWNGSGSPLLVVFWRLPLSFAAHIRSGPQGRWKRGSINPPGAGYFRLFGVVDAFEVESSPLAEIDALEIDFAAFYVYRKEPEGCVDEVCAAEVCFAGFEACAAEDVDGLLLAVAAASDEVRVVELEGGIFEFGAEEEGCASYEANLAKVRFTACEGCVAEVGGAADELRPVESGAVALEAGVAESRVPAGELCVLEVQFRLAAYFHVSEGEAPVVENGVLEIEGESGPLRFRFPWGGAEVA